MEEKKLFEVEVTEILKKKVIVEAINPKEAEEQAELDWDHGKFTLDYNDFHSTKFNTIGNMERSIPMKEFDITITETLQKTVTVQANTQEEAEDLVHNQWSQGIHVLDAENFVDATIKMEVERENLLEVLLVEPMKPPKEVLISDTLEALQEAVGGNIETVRFFDDPIEIICNEEGKINGLPLNRAIYNEQGEVMEIMAGSFLIVGDGVEQFESLSMQMKEKYAKEFEKPEKFYSLAGELIVQKIEPPKEKDVMKKTDREK